MQLRLISTLFIAIAPLVVSKDEDAPRFGKRIRGSVSEKHDSTHSSAMVVTEDSGRRRLGKKGKKKTEKKKSNQDTH